MARISRAHPIRTVLATCAATAIAGLFLGAPVADAGALGAVTGQVEEVASQAGLSAPPLQSAVEAVAAPVETATAPVESVIAGAPPAAGVPRATPSPSVDDPGTLPDRAASTVTGVTAAAGTAARSAGGIVQATTGRVEAATETSLPSPPVPTGGAAPASPDEGASPQPTARPDTSAPPVFVPTTAAPTSQRNIYVRHRRTTGPPGHRCRAGSPTSGRRSP